MEMRAVQRLLAKRHPEMATSANRPVAGGKLDMISG